MLDDIAYEVVGSLEKGLDEEEILKKLSRKYVPHEVSGALGEIRRLEEQGMLFSEDPYVGCQEAHTSPDIVKSLCLNVSHDCNLRCEYCFASQGGFGGSRSLMPFEVGAAAIDFLLKNSGNRKNLEVDFFGGEPLMNFDVVKKIVQYSREKETKYGKRISFTITTNAVLLTPEINDFINENMDNIVLSLDGRREVNDRVRYRTDKSGTYHSILPAIKELAASRGQKDYYVRGTFTGYNLDFADDVLHLADLGLKQISVEPVVASEDKGYALRENHIDKVYKEYERLAVEYIDRHKSNKGFNFFHFELDLNNGPCTAKRVKGCGAGCEYLAVTPDGEIYPCHQFVGNMDFYLGNVMEPGINHEIRCKFIDCNIFTKEKCRDCWSKFFCSGGCAANAWQFNRSISQPYELGCKLQKKRTECALMIQAALTQA